MSTLLSIESSPRGEYSISRSLTAAFVAEWQKTHAGGTVVNRDLFKTDLPFVDLPWIAGAYTPAEQHSPEMKKALEVGNTLIAELQAADHIVLGTSMYNFSTPGAHTEPYDKETGYLKQIFGFIGITDVNIVLIGGTGAVSMGQKTQADFIAEFTPAVLEAAK